MGDANEYFCARVLVPNEYLITAHITKCWSVNQYVCFGASFIIVKHIDTTIMKLTGQLVTLYY